MRRLEEEVAERALAYVLHPPSDPHDVINYASPHELLDVFAESVGMAFADDAAAESSDQIVAAVDHSRSWVACVAI